MKKLSSLAVKRPVTFLMVSLIVIGFGLFGLSNLNLDLYPDVSFPTITVYTTYEGVAPEDIETLVTRPIEEQVGSISGLKRIRSQSTQGASVVKLHFQWGTDLYQAESDVRKQLDFVRRQIPDEAEQPIVYSYDPNQEPIVVLTLTSDTRSPRELHTFATRQIEEKLERVQGIASTETAGGYERQINIELDNRQMRAYNIDLATISSKLQQANVKIPAGELIEGNKVYSLRTIGDLSTVEEIKKTIVAVRDGQPVRLSSIAEVQDDIAQPIGGVHVDGKDGVILNLYRQSNTNVVSAAEAAIAALDPIRKTLPEDVKIEVLSNKADFINLAINNLFMTGLQAIIMVVIVLLFFLRSGRSSLIIAVSIPISIIATFSIMDWANVSLNIISLSGLALAVGMVVDDAVVVLENIFSFREEQTDVEKSAVWGAQEVAVPVVVSTLTTLVVFLPVLFVPGIAGFLFRDLALTLSFALSISSIVALSLIPLMSSQVFSDTAREGKGGPGFMMRRILKWSKQNIWKRIAGLPLLIVAGVLYPFFWIFYHLFSYVGRYASKSIKPTLTRFINRLESSYKRRLDQLLHRSGMVVTGTLVLFLLSLPLYNFLGGEFFPQVDQNRIILEVQREPGVNLFELERTFKHVERIIEEEVPEARLIVSDFGDKEGIEGADRPGGYQGTVRIELVPTSERKRSQFEITDLLLDRLDVVPGAEIKEVVDDPLNPEGESGLIVQIFGYDQQQKKLLAGKVKQHLRDMEGINNIFTTADQGRPELRVTMDRERISRVGLNTNQVATALSNAVQGNIATHFVDQGVEHEVVVQLERRQLAHSAAIKDIQIKTPQDTWMPLSNLARIERFQGPTRITRINQQRVTEIQADLAGIDLRSASKRVSQKMEQIQWPEGYRYELGGTAEEQQQSFYYLIIAFVIAAILTYMVMASQFESLTEPFIIIFTIPLALTGVLLILWITQTPISVTSMVGLILLSGIVVNNGIVMIDYIKILQIRHKTRHDAIVQGATRRLRPILMTAFTTILSMVPLALELGSGSETWSPMARTVIGGLTMSTLLMLFVVPCMYNLLNKLQHKLGMDTIRKEDPLAYARENDDAS